MVEISRFEKLPPSINDLTDIFASSSQKYKHIDEVGFAQNLFIQVIFIFILFQNIILILSSGPLGEPPGRLSATWLPVGRPGHAI